MGACYHIDTVTCENCRPRFGMPMYERLPWIDPLERQHRIDMEQWERNMQRYRELVQEQVRRVAMTDQQDQQWRDLAGL